MHGHRKQHPHPSGRATALTLLGALLLLSGCTRYLKPAQVTWAAEKSEASADLEIAQPSGYPIVEVSCNGATGQFVLDTGGTGTLIVRDGFFKQSGGRIAGRITYRRSKWRVGVLPKLELGEGLTVRNAPTVVTDLDQMAMICGMRIDGILTVGSVPGVQWDIDLPQRRLTVRSSDQAIAPAGMVAIPRPQHLEGDPRPFTMLEVDGHEVPLLLDTGSYVAMEMSTGLAPWWTSVLKEPRESYGASGFGSKPAKTKRGYLEDIKVGPVEVDRISVHFHGVQEDEAVAGSVVLHHYRLIHDNRSLRTFLVGPRRLEKIVSNPAAVKIAEDLCREQLR